MTANIQQETTPNRLLAGMTPDDFALVAQWLTPADLPLRHRLETSNRKIEHAYFIEHGLASVVATLSRERSIEVGIVGREGVTGLALLLETDRSPNETFIQGAGSGHRIEAGHLTAAMDASPNLRRHLLRYSHAFVIQMSSTVLANGRSPIPARLARWLLMAHDRADSDELSMTQEFLSIMLAVRRPSVTVQMNAFEAKGYVSVARSKITILNREGLAATANGSYGIAEAELERLCPVPRAYSVSAMRAAYKAERMAEPSGAR